MGGHQWKSPQGKKTTIANFMLQAWLHERENAGQWREGNPYRLDPTYLRSSCFPTFSDLRFHANIPSSCLDDADFVVMIRPLKFVFLGTRWPMLGSHRRCSEEIVDAAIVSARLITLHHNAEPSSHNAEPSSITWIEAQIKTFGPLTHLNDTWVHYDIVCTAHPRRVLSIAVQIPVLITVTAA